ncbi:MAG: N-acetylmuramoyl-L-alanine amidase, partial [Kiritimatiellae bacterium]|nr:N-acetylmuramoyl-L-alanine amidase [Kiritimatiellia bacterium]
PPPAPDAPAPKPAASAPKAKPWQFSYTAGSQAAKADGVLVYLGRPAVADRRTRKAGPSDLDRKSTVAPLLQARSKPLVEGRPLRVCLDPGHGGQDAGAASADGRTVEKAIALDIAQRVARMLRKDGVEVTLTRPDNRTFLPLPDRPALARAKQADLFVSIHLNANASSGPRGVETYVFPARGMESTSYEGRGASDESKQWWPGNGSDWGNVQLGFCIQRRLAAASGLPDRGLRRARFVVVREARMPAALVECGFLTNARDLAVLRGENGRENIARGIYEGIFDFAWGTMAPGLPAHKPGPPVVEVVSPASAPAPPVERTGALEFVPSPVAPWTPPKPAVPADDPSDDPATSAARKAALRAAGLIP